MRQVFTETRFSAINTPSGVSAQPWGEDETRKGAHNRAQYILEATDADIGVGLEGGVVESPYGLMTCAWCVVIARDGRMGLGGGSHILLPPIVAQAVRGGTELGLAMDRLVGEHNTKRNAGAIGILTAGLTNRQKAYEMIIQFAVAPFRQPNYYKGISE